MQNAENVLYDITVHFRYDLIKSGAPLAKHFETYFVNDSKVFKTRKNLHHNQNFK